MLDFVSQYFEFAKTRLEVVATQSAPQIHQAAVAIAESIANEKDFLTFGSGHSELIAREVFWRAGGLAPALHIADYTGGDFERVEGIAQFILGHYQLRAGSTLIVISNSGINPVPVEVALLGKAASLTVVALTSLAHSQAVASRHSNGKKLYEIADIVIDTHIDRGDIALEIPNSSFHVGATSTLVGVGIMQAITVQVAILLQERGIHPPVLVSANVPEGDAHNRQLKQHYMPRLVRYPVDTADLR